MRNVTPIRATVVLFLAGACFFTVRGVAAQSADERPSAPNNFDYNELARVPIKARARKNPQEGHPEAALVGKKLFAQHCAECHGSTAEGGKKAPSLRADEVQQASPGALFWILTNGVVRRGMPVWSKLPEPQRWAIVAYIKTLAPSRDATAQ